MKRASRAARGARLLEQVRVRPVVVAHAARDVRRRRGDRAQFGQRRAGERGGALGFRRPVALKVLEAPNPTEVELSARLQHPNIVEVYDVSSETEVEKYLVV